jgi:predicted MFS family arabinose efflux permease
VSRAYLTVLAAAALCYAALGAVLRILPSHVGHDLGGSAAAVGLAVGAPALTAIFARPAAGRVADRIGPRPLVVGGAAAMAAGTLPALGGGLATLDLSRLIVGAGEGAMMAAAVLWLLRLAGPERRGRALGHIGLANYAGLAIGPLIADALGGDARAVLIAAAVLPLVAAPLVMAVPRAPRADVARAEEDDERRGRARTIAAAIARPGAGLALVNVGYVALIAFGAQVGQAAAIVPVFAVTVIAARTLGASVPDRLGPETTLRVCVVAEGLGLIALALAGGGGAAPTPALAATVVLAAGQALAVPALGVLALRRVPAARHGAAAGLFFSFFDAGVGLGGPLVGAAARATSPATAVALSGVAVLAVWPVALTWQPSPSAATLPRVGH